jgi:hypothetical protein
LEARAFKDVIPRYKTMQGERKGTKRIARIMFQAPRILVSKKM